jgi:hypothetical protein
VFQPDTIATVFIAPEALVVSTQACSAAASFSAPFTLVITPVRAINASVDSATFTLIDGSSLGGPSVTFPRPQLTQMFGTTVIGNRRTFDFAPTFRCPATWPRTIAADIQFDDGQRFTARLALQ